MSDLSVLDGWVGPPAQTTAKQNATVTYPSGLPLRWKGNRPEVRTVGSGWANSATKRVFDVVLASLLLIFFTPTLLMAAAAVRLTSRGPILFRQSRVGQDGVPFELYKFRTMKVDHCDAAGLRQPDARSGHLTVIGDFLRRTSIDELPQIFNVLSGRMSLVGPRPHVPGQLAASRPYRELVPYYDMRQTVRPGLTGWAQANGFRGSTTLSEPARSRIEHDVAYIQNASLLLDVRIIILTAIREFLRSRSMR